MSGTRDGLPRSIQTRLARHARAIGVDPNVVLTRYVVERLLYRLSRSAHAEQFVLKGAMLLLVWLGETLRPTRDVDLLGYGDLSDAELSRVFRDICVIAVEPDGVTFDPRSIRTESIREEDAYGGRRITLFAAMGAARVRVQIDVGIGDDVRPAPAWLDYPSLLEQPQARLRAYPRESVIAEKLHAMTVLGLRNSRMKDYFDVHALFREGKVTREGLATALRATFLRRGTPISGTLPTGLSDEFAAEGDKQAQWQAFLRRHRLQAPPLPEVVAAIRARFIETGLRDH